jgi:hypothetical protein
VVLQDLPVATRTLHYQGEVARASQSAGSRNVTSTNPPGDIVADRVRVEHADIHGTAVVGNALVVARRRLAADQRPGPKPWNCDGIDDRS